MLPAAHRLTRRADFTAALKGRRVRSGPLVVHVHVASAPSDGPAGCQPARLGLIINRAVGGSVVRHRTARRIRAAARPLLTHLPEGSLVAVRALPDAAQASVAELAAALTTGLATALATAPDWPATASTGRTPPAGQRLDTRDTGQAGGTG